MVSLPKNKQLYPNYEEISDEYKFRAIQQNLWPLFLNIKIIKDKQSLMQYYIQKKTKQP